MDTSASDVSDNHQGSEHTLADEDAAAEAIATRRAQLLALLDDRGLTLRPESRLCSNYISRGEGDPEFIVTTMEEMDWYHANGNYHYEVMEDTEDLDGYRRYDNTKGKVRARRYYFRQRLLAGGFYDDESMPQSLLPMLREELFDAYIEEAKAILSVISNNNNNHRAMLHKSVLQQPRTSQVIDHNSKAAFISMLPLVVRQELERWFGPDDAYEEIGRALLKNFKEEALQHKKQQIMHPVYHTQAMRNLLRNKNENNADASKKQWREERHNFYIRNKESLAKHWEIHESYAKEIFMEITNDYKKYQI
ncbi:hypothetical protein BDB00DRAFT_136849 [Zychaea mexicana]|uniref:uncharacterized protein n=1 Tax=Zychaea mexicana TaxID=64656 RepID=UPI0022FEAE2F|nr:uncharacterized protein BDB00DRAFT_136849 [Zychaea mexicana]KAI9496214.1 hypothetical protein BDB00DRAFT_136849 [Zychaea mexicana]